MRAAGERRLLHELSVAERERSRPALTMALQGDLNNDFESLSQALGVHAGEAAGLSSEGQTPVAATLQSAPGESPPGLFLRCAFSGLLLLVCLASTWLDQLSGESRAPE